VAEDGRVQSLQACRVFEGAYDALANVFSQQLAQVEDQRQAMEAQLADMEAQKDLSFARSEVLQEALRRADKVPESHPTLPTTEPTHPDTTAVVPSPLSRRPPRQERRQERHERHLEQRGEVWRHLMASPPSWHDHRVSAFAAVPKVPRTARKVLQYPPASTLHYPNPSPAPAAPAPVSELQYAASAPAPAPAPAHAPAPAPAPAPPAPAPAPVFAPTASRMPLSAAETNHELSRISEFSSGISDFEPPHYLPNPLQVSCNHVTPNQHSPDALPHSATFHRQPTSRPTHHPLTSPSLA